jgi:FMN-dependent NADH-azoreductase
MDHLSPLLKTVFGFVGIHSVHFVAAAGTAMPNAAEIVAAAMAQAQKIAA